MSGDSLTFLIPTHSENRPLARALNSVVHQLGERDSVLVIGDVTDGPLPRVERLVANYGAQVKYLPYTNGTHDFGHSQLNHGISQAQGDYIHCSDDDDSWTPTAVAAMRRMIHEAPGVPHLMRFRAYYGLIFWDERGVIRRDHIGGHCLLMPNIPGKIGLWAPEYSGDFDFVRSTIDLHGGDESVVWEDDLVVVARPN